MGSIRETEGRAIVDLDTHNRMHLVEVVHKVLAPAHHEVQVGSQKGRKDLGIRILPVHVAVAARMGCQSHLQVVTGMVPMGLVRNLAADSHHILLEAHKHLFLQRTCLVVVVDIRGP